MHSFQKFVSIRLLQCYNKEYLDWDISVTKLQPPFLKVHALVDETLESHQLRVLEERPKIVHSVRKSAYGKWHPNAPSDNAYVRLFLALKLGA